MFIRETKTKNKKTGKVYLTHQLVETIQTEKGPRNRPILYLGRLTLPKSSFKSLAKAFEARLSGQKELFPGLEPEIKALIDAAILANKPETLPLSPKTVPKPSGTAVLSPETLEAGNARTLGAEMVGHQAWNQMAFNEILLSSGFSPKERALAEAVVLGRLISPGSDLHTHRWLTSRSAIGEILGHGIDTVGKDAVYEIADRLWEKKEEIEVFLSRKTRERVPTDSMVLLYDLTNTTLEGSAAQNSLAKRGFSKEKRSDCPLIGLSLVVDSRGFPIASHVTPGNQSEPETLPTVLDRMDACQSALPLAPAVKPTMVMDQGIATRDNIQLLKERGFPFCIVERGPVEKPYAELFETAQKSFTWFAPRPKTDPEEGVFLLKQPEKNGTVRVLVLSEARKAKEEAMDTLKETRFLADLKMLSERLSERPRRQETVARRLGHLEGRYSSVAKYYKITLKTKAPETPPETPSGEKRKKSGKPVPLLVSGIEWVKKPTRDERKKVTGAYVIETSHTDLSASRIWSLYVTLTRVEGAFRALKTDLGLRPVFHQNADRTRAHLFLSILAYHLLSEIEYRMKEKGDSRFWSSLRQTLSNHVRASITGQDPHTGIEHTIRMSFRPEADHRQIFDLLGVEDPTHKIRTRKTGTTENPTPAP